MVIKVYYCGVSALKETKKHQQRAMLVLDTCKVQYERIDITEPGNEESKELVFSKAQKRLPKNQTSPPFFFRDEDYLGDYEDFEDASDDDRVLQFLGLAAEVPESTSKLQGEGNEAVATNGVVNGEAEVIEENEHTEPLTDELEEEVVLVNQETDDGSKDDEEVEQDESEE